MTVPVFAQQWRNGTGEQTIDGTSQAALIGYNSYNKIVKPIDNLLSNYCNEYLQYTSSTTITVMAGTCVVSNSQGSIRLFMQDASNTVLSSSNLDSGSILSSTKYYVYATAATNSSTSSTYYISTSSSAPSGQTYYYQIGYFTTDSSSQFTGIVNNNWNSYVNGNSSKSCGVVYQALTDGFAIGNIYSNGQGNGCFGGQGISDSSSSPSTILSQAVLCANGQQGYQSITIPVQKGNK